MANADTHIDIGIVVRDIDACLPFYRDVLGPAVRRRLQAARRLAHVAARVRAVRRQARDARARRRRPPTRPAARAAAPACATGRWASTTSTPRSRSARRPARRSRCRCSQLDAGHPHRDDRGPRRQRRRVPRDEALTLTMTDDLPAEGLVDRVRAVAPLIASTSFEAEAQRRPLDEVIDALKATGVFRSFVPARYGGYEIDMPTYVDIGLAVAHADPSMGWVTTFYMEHNWLLTHVRRGAAGRDLRRPAVRARARARVNPSGRAVPAGRRQRTRCRGTGSSAPASATPTGCC